jgi:hypothetical protein
MIRPRELDREKDLPIIWDKAFELANELASTDVLADLANELDVDNSKGYVFFRNGKFEVADSSGNRLSDIPPKKMVESGVQICKNKQGKIRFIPLRLADGLSMFPATTCSAEPDEEYYDDFLGSIHTHPGGTLSPSGSTGDLKVFKQLGDKISCIATRYDTLRDDADNVVKKRFGATCYLQSISLPTDDELEEYDEQALKNYNVSHKEVAFLPLQQWTKASESTFGKYMGAFGEGYVVDYTPRLVTKREGDSIITEIIKQKGVVPFMDEEHAKRFDSRLKGKLGEMYEIIHQEREYDATSGFKNYKITEVSKNG